MRALMVASSSPVALGRLTLARALVIRSAMLYPRGPGELGELDRPAAPQGWRQSGLPVRALELQNTEGQGFARVGVGIDVERQPIGVVFHGVAIGASRDDRLHLVVVTEVEEPCLQV